ncbi:MAG TPA: alpha/beta fold hydrolase [Nocardioidaceae bacterium]|nr:alpha/beta fold hydrolase [Nocardioidaceae bacterium]
MMSPLAEYLCPPGFSGPRGFRALAAEASVVREARHLACPVSTIGRLGGVSRGRPRGDDQPVLLVPGFLAGDATLRPMSMLLRRAGYRTYRSRVHANVRCVQATGEALERRLEELVERLDRPVALIGHSLGGLLAKALAHRRPELVAGIVTMGSPLLAPGAVHPVLAFDLRLLARLQRWGFGGLMGDDCTSGDCARTSWQELSAPAHDGFVFTSIYSRRDGIVDWRACLDPAATHVEVRCSHVGMAVDQPTHRHVLTALGRITEAEDATDRRAAPAATAG